MFYEETAPCNFSQKRLRRISYPVNFTILWITVYMLFLPEKAPS